METNNKHGGDDSAPPRGSTPSPATVTESATLAATTTDTSPPQKSFKCSYPECGRSYRRKEHLNRHSARHRQGQAFDCPFCDRTFGRNDTLRQHVRIYHQDKELHSSRAIKACDDCRSRKSRCDGNLPCAECTQSGLQCSFDRSLPAARRNRQCSEEQKQQVIQKQRSRNGDRTPAAPPRPARPGPAVKGIVENETIQPLQPVTLNGPAIVIDTGLFDIIPYVEAYFERFHPTWPFLHRATFDPSQEPIFLVQSVVMVGLWVTKDHRNRVAARELHGKLVHSVYRQRDKWDMSGFGVERSQPWPTATYQGILLQLIFALLKDNGGPMDLKLTHLLPNECSQLLLALVHSCLRSRIFFYPNMLTKFNHTDPYVYIWLGIEEIKRFGLALYKVCQMCHMDPDQHRQIRLLSLADLQFAMPSSDVLWNLTSDLAQQLASRPEAENNSEENWISQAAPLLISDAVGFDWI